MGEETKAVALEILRELPVIDTIDRSHGVILEQRLIGSFEPKVENRNFPQLRKIIDLQGWLQNLLTDNDNSPSTTFDPKEGRITITTRKTLAEQ